MDINFNKSDQEVIEELRTFTGLPLTDIIQVFEYFSLYVLTSYAENEKIKIPFFGEFNLTFNGINKINTEETLIEGTFNPHVFLQDTIKEYEKAKDTGEYYNISLIKKIKNKSKKILEKQLEEN